MCTPLAGVRQPEQKLFVAVDEEKKRERNYSLPMVGRKALLGTVTVRCGATVLRVYMQGKGHTLDLKELRIVPLRSRN